MKKKYRHKIKDKELEIEYTYIPLRYILAVLITCAEFLLIIGAILAICYYFKWFFIVTVVIQIACVIKIVSSDDNPDYKAPWLLVVLLLPIAGFTLYFLLYSRQLGRRYRKRFAEISKANYKFNDESTFCKLKEESEIAHAQAKMLCNIADTHLFANTKQQYFASGEMAWPIILSDLKNAEKFIYLEFFIIESGKFWDSVLDILKEKAQKGVEVKLVYDDIGCMKTLPADYFYYLKKRGIQATPFSILKANTNSEFNNRSHRKMIIVDGKVAYTGGINLADEYVNEKKRFGYWKDCAIRVEGRCVWEFIELFLIDYGMNVIRLPQRRTDYYPNAKFEEKGYLIPFGDGPTPLYERRVAMSAIQNMIDCATDYCWITTPYLIPDNDTCLSLERAALKGVDVRIVLPGIPDKKVIFSISRSYYLRLIKAGVKIYEYTPGFIHSKIYLVDDAYAIVGTVNLDYRSLAHNFENGV